MASLALLAIPQSFFAGLGPGALAGAKIALGAAAAMIDARIIMPALFPPEDPVGQKADDLHIMSAAEGVGIPNALGGASRTAAHLIWVSDIKTGTELAATSGKGGGFEAPGQQEFYVDAAIAISEGEVENLSRLLADGKGIFAETGAPLSVTDTMVVSGAGTNSMRVTQQTIPGLEDPSLAQLEVGAFGTVSGFPRSDVTNFSTSTITSSLGSLGVGTINIPYSQAGASATAALGTKIKFANHSTEYFLTNAETATGSGTGTMSIGPGLTAQVPNGTAITLSHQNNGTYLVTAAGINVSNSKHFAIFQHPIVNFVNYGLPGIASITVEQTPTAWDTTRVETVTIYKGTDFQDPDPLVESYKGAGKVPGWRGICYAVLENLFLRDYANRMPNMSAKIRETTALTYSTAIDRLLARSFLSSEWYSTAGLTAQLDGYVFEGPISGAESLQPPLLVGNIVASEEDGVMTFYERDSVPATAVTASDLGASEFGDRVPYPIRVLDADRFRIPNEVSVKFQDPAKNYQSGEAHAKRPDLPHGDTVTVQLPVALDEGDATALAYRIMYEAELARRRVRLSLPPRYLRVRESTVLSLPVFGSTWGVFVEKVDIGHNGLVEIEGVLDDPASHSWAATSGTQGEALGSNGTGFSGGSPLVHEILDSPALTDAHADVPGFYYAVSAEQPNGFSGGQLLWSADGGLSYALVSSSLRKATMGRASNALGSATTGFWDRASSVNVFLNSGELSSADEFSVLTGSNRARIGFEIIGFATATLEADGSYTLSNLLRGLRNTEAFATGHVANEWFVLLDGSIGWQPVNIATVNSRRHFKSVGARMSAADVLPFVYRVTGNTMRPFSVAHVTGSRDGSNNLTIDWVQRSRRIARLFSEEGAPAALDAVSGRSYEVDVMDGATVKRTITTTSESASYLASEQTTDGFTPGDPITVRIYEMSETVGRGNVKEATV